MSITHILSNDDGYLLNACYKQGSVLSTSQVLTHSILNDTLYDDTVSDATVHLRTWGRER